MSETLKSARATRPLRSFWSAVALCGLASGVWFIFEQFHETPIDRALPPELADEPDLYIEDAIISQFRADGKLKYRLASQEIRHFELDQVTRMRAPELTLYNLDSPPWNIVSEHGDIRQRPTHSGDTEEVVLLRESVSVKQQFEDGRHTILYAPSLDLYPDRQYAETSQDVMIDTEVGRTLAVGLEAHLARGLLTLSSTVDQRVHTIVLPGQFK